MAVSTMELAGDLRAGDAPGLRSGLMAALAGGDVTIGSVGVTAVDAAVVQVLVSAKRTAAQLDRNLQIEVVAGGALDALLARLALGTAQVA